MGEERKWKGRKGWGGGGGRGKERERKVGKEINVEKIKERRGG